jgi:hypothetical protein
MDRNEKIKIGLMIGQILCLLLAVYVAFSMYQYRNGWDDGLRFYNETHFLARQPCELVLNQSGV